MKIHSLVIATSLLMAGAWACEEAMENQQENKKQTEEKCDSARSFQKLPRDSTSRLSESE